MEKREEMEGRMCPTFALVHQIQSLQQLIGQLNVFEAGYELAKCTVSLHVQYHWNPCTRLMGGGGGEEGRDERKQSRRERGGEEGREG